ncbi:thioredoxin-like [Chiloscyllium plagiosum]|uniref:thioredoxin-like n=1 Tax=Chiloscyllium plagiosum TaxID=36176 RepID=UPI001CB86C42|nr:thioredoxin-like [Chiloscyllium plagiosum]XP_060712008.1 thioredoxin-like [Hemiscyllium ocellatum]
MVVRHVEDAKQFQNLLSQTEQLVVVMYSAEWCSNCRMIRPHFYNLSEQLTNVVFVEVDVDDAEPLARSAGITCMPTFHFFRRSARMGEFSGTKREKLERLLDELQ